MSELLKINVSEYIEKKNGLSFLPWARAWAEVLKIDPEAQWFAHEYGPQGSEVPYMQQPDGSCMVKVSVTIKGKCKGSILPVMNHRNQAIKGPDAFAVNTAIMRCLTKAVAMHGLGLNLYVGEDLPLDTGEPLRVETVSREAPGKALRIKPLPDPDLPQDAVERVQEIVTDILIAHEEGRELDSIELFYHQLVDNDEKIFAWNLLAPHSKLRAFLKANRPQTQATMQGVDPKPGRLS